MPLLPGKKNIGRNIRAEEKAGKPHKQSLAIALSVSRKPKKKMAKGGEVGVNKQKKGLGPGRSEAGSEAYRYGRAHNTEKAKDMHAQTLEELRSMPKPKIQGLAEGGQVTAKTQGRPMPNKRYNDSRDLMQNDGDKAPGHDSWTDRAPEKAASTGPRPKLQPINGAAMAKSDVIKAHPLDSMGRRLKDDEVHLQITAGTGSAAEQPPEHYDEEDAAKEGPSVPALHMKRMAEGGMINEEVSMDRAEEDEVEHPTGLEEDDDQMGPASKEFMADHFAHGGDVDGAYEDRPDKGYGAIIFKADGGPVSEEEAEEAHASIASAIMAKRHKMDQDSGSHDDDMAEAYADGGMVDIEENAEEEPNAYYGENKAALKENYDEGMSSYHSGTDDEDGRELEDEDEHDRSMVGAIRRKMSKKSPITK